MHTECLEDIVEELNYTCTYGWSIGQVDEVNIVPSNVWCLSHGLTILVSERKTKDIHYYLTFKGLWFRFLVHKGLIKSL